MEKKAKKEAKTGKKEQVGKSTKGESHELGLSADKDDRHIGAVVADLGVPLGSHVVVRGCADHREADQEDIGLGV